MADEVEHEQDPELPPGWFAWQLYGTWAARPPGRPDPKTYVHATTKADLTERAWRRYRAATKGK
jgi:hypothetical protein